MLSPHRDSLIRQRDCAYRQRDLAVPHTGVGGEDEGFASLELEE